VVLKLATFVRHAEVVTATSGEVTEERNGQQPTGAGEAVTRSVVAGRCGVT
jgi:hypothetical protein